MSLTKCHGVRGPAVIRPRSFHFRRIRQFRQPQIIICMLRRHGHAMAKLEQKPGGSRGQIAGGNHGPNTVRKLHCGSAAQGAAAGPENVDAQGRIRVDELPDDFTQLFVGMNVAEQEVAGQACRKRGEGGSYEIDVVQCARGATWIVERDREAARNRPAVQIVAGQLAKGARGPVGVRARSKSQARAAL